MHQRKVYGIVPGENDRYVVVALRGGTAKRSAMTVRKWNIGDKLQALRLLHRGVCCGIPSVWKSAASRSPQNSRGAAHPEGPFTPWVDAGAAAFHIEGLSDNLLALIPDDAYLCTIPLFCAEDAPASFISVHTVPMEHDRLPYFKIGIIVDKKVIAVHSLSPKDPGLLESHIGRIRRWLARACPHVVFPEHVFLLGHESTVSMDHFICRTLVVKIGKKTLRQEDEMKALGCALFQRSAGVPVFSGPEAGGAVRLRLLRGALWISSVAIFIATALAAAPPLVANYFLEKDLRACEAQKRAVVFDNPAIRALVDHNDSLGASIVRLTAKAGSPTQWGRFFHTVAALRPDGLYFEKFGSEIAGSKTAAVRIAISGSAQNETLVTEVIARLQKSGLVADIALSSMEKNKTRPTLCDFKFICTLKLTNP